MLVLLGDNKPSTVLIKVGDARLINESSEGEE